MFCRPKSDISCLPEAEVFRSTKEYSLEAIKELPSIMIEETIHSGSDRRRVKMVAEGCHKVLALLVISHFSLKGETTFRAGLRGKLGEVEHLLSAGVGGDTIGELIYTDCSG